MVFRQAEFVDRVNFARFLNDTERLGNAVEIGTHRGEFACTFMKRWRGDCLYCVDPWSTPIGYEYQETMLPDRGANREEDYKCTKGLLYPFIRDGRVKLLRCTSFEALEHFDNNSLDFVYVDGDHRTDMVYVDLQDWYRKLRPGGILAGHDIIDHPPDDWTSQVQPAVVDFANEKGLDVWLVIETLCMPWSYYLVKE